MFHWILFAGALATLLASFFGDSVGEILFLWGVAFALAFAGCMVFYRSRTHGRQHPPARMIDPATLQKMREQAKARRETHERRPPPPPASTP